MIKTTPETDAFAIKFKTTCGEKYWVPVDIARKLERERDEAREDSDQWKDCATKLVASSGWHDQWPQAVAHYRKLKEELS